MNLWLDRLIWETIKKSGRSNFKIIQPDILTLLKRFFHFSYQQIEHMLVKHNREHLFALLWSHLSDNLHSKMNDPGFYSKSQTHHKMHIFRLFRDIAPNTLRSFSSILLNKRIMSRWRAMAYIYCEAKLCSWPSYEFILAFHRCWTRINTKREPRLEILAYSYHST